jgi:hypothetical protein
MCGGEEPPVTWIVVLLLILGVTAGVALRIDARTRDRPAELDLPLAQRWRAMGGG